MSQLPPASQRRSGAGVAAGKIETVNSDDTTPHADAAPVGRRGTLFVYLGAAPGVGKTFAMLGEAQRRLARGTDVVVGYVETHDRANTLAQLTGLEVIARKEIDYRGATFTEMDTGAIIARAPAVVLVDELAHTNVPGSRHEKRAEDVRDLRAAGIDVITTVNIQHLESLNDEVERITGVRQRETVPDEVVRTAEQIQLIDMSPEALRRRLAHGNVYRATQIDASLSHYFRVGNLTALRELALLWLADRVDDALDDYRRAHRITTPWPIKERIVVALTGGTETETLLRRGARLAQRAAGSELLAVHVIATDGLRRVEEAHLGRAQQLCQSLDGSFHTVIGEDVAAAVVDFATGVNATMIVTGVSRNSPIRRLFTRTTAARIAVLAGSIDVHLVNHEEHARLSPHRSSWTSLSPRRQISGWVAALLLPALLTFFLQAQSDHSNLPSAVLLYLALSVLVALVGGLWPTLVAASTSFLMLNWFFTPPTGKFTIAEPANATALLIFVAVAVGVAVVVDFAARRSIDATRARGEAAALAGLSRSVLTGQDTAEAVVRQVAEAFALEGAALLRRTPTGWASITTAGTDPSERPSDKDTRLTVDDDHVLVLRGPQIRASDQRVLESFAVQTGLVLQYRRLREEGARAAVLERADATTTALLRAVSHDLRTPLATMRASVDGLVTGGERLEAEDRLELLSSVDFSTAQLESLIDNLLDLSRLETGLLKPQLLPHSLEEVLPLALAGMSGDHISLELEETAPLVRTDAGLLERIVANLASNAIRHAHGSPVRVIAQVLPGEVAILVVDQGPGVDESLKKRMFEPFQRTGDTGGAGLGLGLAVARGFAESIGATLTAEDTPGGGLTMVLSVPLDVTTQDRP